MTGQDGFSGTGVYRRPDANASLPPQRAPAQQPHSSSEGVAHTTPPPSVMEQVLFHLHHRLCHFGLQHSSGKTRRLLENFLLVLAILGFGALIMLHRSFVFRPAVDNCATQCFQEFGGKSKADVTHVIFLPGNTTIQSSLAVWKLPVGTARPDNATVAGNPMTNSQVLAAESTCSSSTEVDVLRERILKGDGEPQELHRMISYSFSTTKAYLLLDTPSPSQPRSKHQWLLDQLTVRYVIVSHHDHNCFGEPFLQLLIQKAIGVDTIVLNWFLALLEQEKDEPPDDDGPITGYIYQPQTRRLRELQLQSSSASYKHSSEKRSGRLFARSSLYTWSNKLNVLIRTSFLFFFCTTLVSFTLCETQERMLEFTQELSRRVSVSLPLSDLVTTHVISNLVFVPIMVGMMFFLIEFYSGDKFLAFLVMSIVWCVEVFSVVSLRSYQGLSFFPRIFFLLFCLFHIYFFANPNGFAYTALLVVGCFMWHSMVFFWHRYELPAVTMGRVTLDRPRMTNEAVMLYRRPSSSSLPSGMQTPQRHSIPGASANQTSAHTPVSSNVSGVTDPTLPTRSNNVSNSPLTHSHPSFSTTSSRNTSGLFRQQDDDDDGSYLYFMEGEVVLHRQHQQPSRSSNGSIHNASRPSGNPENSQPYTGQQHHLLLDPQQQHPVGLDMSEQDEDDSLFSSSLTPRSLPPRNGGAARGDNSSTVNTEYANESSVLQAIMDVRLRRRNRSTATNDAANPPIFPALPS